MIKKAVLVVSLAVLLMACGAEEEEAERETLEPSPLPVTAAAAQVDTLFEVVSSTGRVSSARTQSLNAQIQGEVVQAPEFVGQEVRDGEIVFRMITSFSATTMNRDPDLRPIFFRISSGITTWPLEDIFIVEIMDMLRVSHLIIEQADDMRIIR